MGYTFGSNATVRPVGWATQLSVCSGKVPWSDKLKAVFSNESGYDLVSLRKLI